MIDAMFENPSRMDTMKPRHTHAGTSWLNARMRSVDGLYDGFVLNEAQKRRSYITEFSNVCRGIVTGRKDKGSAFASVIRQCGGMQIFDTGGETFFSVPISRPDGLSDAQFKQRSANELNAILANLAVRIAMMKGAKALIVTGDETVVRPVAGGLVAYGLLNGVAPLTDEGEQRWADPRNPIVGKLYSPYMHPQGVWGLAESTASSDKMSRGELAHRLAWLGMLAPDPISPEHQALRAAYQRKEDAELGQTVEETPSSNGFAALKQKATAKKFDRTPPTVSAANVEVYMNCATMQSMDVSRKQRFAQENGRPNNAYQQEMF